MTQHKLGTFYGVLIPNITMMLGVILFLRLGVIVSHAGIWAMTGIILLSLGVMLVTSLSIAAMATNMAMGSGGVYYLITRSLGIEIGGAAGFALYVSQIISISLTVSGFAYLLSELYPELPLSLVEAITLVVLAALSSWSAKGALQLQLVILLVLLAGVGAVLGGSMEWVQEPANPTPFFEGGKLSFWQAFALFYPAMTGIEAGMALSGALRRPGHSLFVGNIVSLLFVASLYLGLSLYLSWNIPRPYLLSDPFIAIRYAKIGGLVSLGIMAATLSSALGSLLGAPRMLESMARDGIAPSLFAKTYGRYQEPRWALLFTTLVSMVIIMGTRIDDIIPILTMICLISYGLLNAVAGMAELMNTPSWRPAIRVPWWLSLFGAFLCLALMLFVDVGWTFAALILFVVFYSILQRRELNAQFQDIRQSLVFFFSRAAVYHLSGSVSHALVWHPQLLVIATALGQHRKLAHLAHNLTRRSGLLTFAAVVPDTWEDPSQLEGSRSVLRGYLDKENIGALVEVQPASSHTEGCVNLIRAYGIGPIQPNTVVLPIGEDLSEVGQIVESCRLMKKNLLFFRDSERVPEKCFIKAFRATPKRVDLWWEGEIREAFDLAVSLITTLRDGRVWAQAQYALRAVAFHEGSQSAIQAVLEDFVRSSRLPLVPKVYLEQEGEHYLAHVKRYSHRADLVCVCIRRLGEDESIDSYSSYLEEVLKQTEGLGTCLYVSSYDEVSHKEMYRYT